MELNSAIKKYGDVPLKFSSYYKYSFTFVGEAEDGAEVSLTTGGDAGDIYRDEITTLTVRTLREYRDDYNFILITKDGETIFQKSEWD